MIKGTIKLTKQGWWFFADVTILGGIGALPLYQGDKELAEKINALGLNDKVEAEIVDKWGRPDLFQGAGHQFTICHKITNAEELLK